MYLQDHRAAQPLGLHAAKEPHHGDLDQVGLGALHGHIDGGALRRLAHAARRAVDLGDVAAPAEERRHIAARAHLLPRPLHILVQVGIRLVVRLQEGGGFLARDAGLTGEAVLAQAVDDGVVCRFSQPPHVRRDLALGQPEDERSRAHVDVLVVFESVEEDRIV